VNRRLKDRLPAALTSFSVPFYCVGDILDFDNSRTPDEVYRYSELAKSRRR